MTTQDYLLRPYHSLFSLDYIDWHRDWLLRQNQPLSKDMVMQQRWPGTDVDEIISFNELSNRMKYSDAVFEQEKMRLSFPKLNTGIWT